MKALIVADDERAITNISEVLKTAGYDTIVYRWMLKALDNIEEIAPHLIVVSTKDYPRHWKTLAQYSCAGFGDYIPEMILYADETFPEEELKKAEQLRVRGIFYSVEVDGLDKLREILSKKPDIFSGYLTDPEQPEISVSDIIPEFRTKESEVQEEEVPTISSLLADDNASEEESVSEPEISESVEEESVLEEETSFSEPDAETVSEEQSDAQETVEDTAEPTESIEPKIEEDTDDTTEEDSDTSDAPADDESTEIDVPVFNEESPSEPDASEPVLEEPTESIEPVFEEENVQEQDEPISEEEIAQQSEPEPEEENDEESASDSVTDEEMNYLTQDATNDDGLDSFTFESSGNAENQSVTNEEINALLAADTPVQDETESVQTEENFETENVENIAIPDDNNERSDEGESDMQNEQSIEDKLAEIMNASKSEAKERAADSEINKTSCNFVFTNPVTLAMVSGMARGYNGLTLEFSPDIEHFIMNLGPGTKIDTASIKTDGKIEDVKAEVMSNDGNRLFLQIKKL